MKEIEKYSHMIDDFAWFNKGNIFEIAKLAKRLGRSYMQDLADRKMALITPQSTDKFLSQN